MVEGPRIPYEFTWTLDKKKELTVGDVTDTLKINLHYDGIFFGDKIEKITVKFEEPITIKNVKYDFHMVDKEIVVNPYVQLGREGDEGWECNKMRIVGFTLYVVVWTEIGLGVIAGALGF